MEEKYKVLVQTNEQGIIVNINSSAFVENADGWITVDEGVGDKYHHAQNNYLEKPLYVLNGGVIVYNYKLAGGKIAERTEDERPDCLESLAAAASTATEPTSE